MKWAIFVDLARPLDGAEQSRLTDALDLVGGGCVGPRRGGGWEAFFALEARDRADAEEKGRAAIRHALQRAGVEVECAVVVQRTLD